MPRAPLALAVMAGCGIEDQAEYVAERAEAECERLEACALGFFEAEYTSPEDCLEERNEALEEEADLYDDLDCKFVPEEAGPCVSRVRGLSCEDWQEGEIGQACDLVWDCSEAYR